MKSEVSPAVIAVVVVVLLVVVGFFFWKGSGGKTFSKDEAQGRLDVKAPTNLPGATGN